MPSKSKAQQRFMGMQLAMQRKSGRNDTGMSETQLRDFAGSVHGSLEDITFHEEAAERDTVMNGETQAHPIHKGYDDCVLGDFGWPEDGDEPKGSMQSSNRDNGYGIHYGAPVDYFGPDTDYRAEEIDVHQYGAGYEPIPLRDYYKSEDHQQERGFRMREQDEYDETRTPGTVSNSNSGAEAYGARNFGDVEKHRDVPDRRTFESQRKFSRAVTEKDEDYAVQISGIDTKKGSKIR